MKGEHEKCGLGNNLPHRGQQCSSKKNETRWRDSEARRGPWSEQRIPSVDSLRDVEEIKEVVSGKLWEPSSVSDGLFQRSSNLESLKTIMFVSSLTKCIVGSLIPGVVIQDQDLRAYKTSTCLLGYTTAFISLCVNAVQYIWSGYPRKSRHDGHSVGAAKVLSRGGLPGGTSGCHLLLLSRSWPLAKGLKTLIVPAHRTSWLDLKSPVWSSSLE